MTHSVKEGAGSERKSSVAFPISSSDAPIWAFAIGDLGERCWLGVSCMLERICDEQVVSRRRVFLRVTRAVGRG